MEKLLPNNMDEEKEQNQNPAEPEEASSGAEDEKKEGGEEKENNAKLFEAKAVYAIFGPDGQAKESGEAKIILKEQEISFSPANGKALSLNLHDVSDSAVADYKIMLRLASGSGVEISQLGYEFENFTKAFNKARNAILAQEMMMQEPTDKGRAECQVLRDGKDLGNCPIQFYETSFLVAPEHEPFFKVYYGDIDSISTQDFTVSLVLGGGKVELKQLGEKFDYVVKIINTGLNAMSLLSQQQLKEMILGLDPLVARELSDSMRDGRAISRSQVSAIAPKAWEEIEKYLATVGIKEEYDYLGKMAAGQEAYVGIKKTLMEEYTWFLVPLFAQNAIALEATSKEGSGRATYFFRLAGRAEFASKKESLAAIAKDLITTINKCLRAINFRREPIYLSEEKLLEPKYWKYRFAISNHPELKILRALFIGRVMHRSDEQWQKDVAELLKFNEQEKDDAKKWQAADDNGEPEETPEKAPEENNPPPEDEK